jgi:hypothetical protein
MRPAARTDREETDPGDQGGERKAWRRSGSPQGRRDARRRSVGVRKAPGQSEPEEERERREEDDGAAEHGNDDRDLCVVRSSCVLDAEAGKEDGLLRECPAGDRGGDGERRGVASRLVAPSPDKCERPDAGRKRGDERDQAGPVDEAVEETSRVEMQNDEPGDRDRTGHEAGAECAQAEALGETGVPAARCVGAEEDGRRIGGSRDGEDADRD